VKSPAITFASFAVLVVFCGGKIVIDQPQGHVGDDGGYILADGSPAFVAGSACSGYQPADVLLSSCPIAETACTYGWTCVGGNSSADEHCASNATGVTPHNYPFFAACPNAGDQASGCAFNNDIPYQRCTQQRWSDTVSASPFLECHLGADGDAFCTAYLSQFVLSDGVPSAKCVPSCEPSNIFDGMCWTTNAITDGGKAGIGQSCDAAECDGLNMCVTRNGQSRCEAPCTTP
jgi:hypothetical protein